MEATRNCRLLAAGDRTGNAMPKLPVTSLAANSAEDRPGASLPSTPMTVATDIGRGDCQALSLADTHSANAAAPVLFVWIGTVAELIKLAPVILELRQRRCRIVPIATGQNDLSQSDLYPLVFPEGIQEWVSRKPITQTPFWFALWAVGCLVRSIAACRRVFRQVASEAGFSGLPSVVRSRPMLLVHGDTVSTLIGAVAGWCAGADVVHVEAGLRSFNLLRPFPEEFCRVGVSRFARWAFCPGEWACGNLHGYRNVRIVNTQENTLLDSLRMALAHRIDGDILSQVPSRYFLFVCHRQENLLDRTFLDGILARIERKSTEIPCIAILHKPAEMALASLGLLDRLTGTPTILALPRQSYFDFTRLLSGAEFVVTDGGSNQEECYFLGKSCLILRRESERREGLGENALLSMKDFSVIDRFLADPSRWNRAGIDSEIRPSRTIAEHLLATPSARAEDSGPSRT